MWKTTLYETSRMTLELRDIVDNGENSVDIWDFDYPSFYTGEEKTKFERKVIDHYYFRQIGQETVGRFLHMFRTRVREIMPYYVQLYESEKLMQDIEDPFATVDYTETFEQESSGQSSASTMNTSEADNLRKFSNTPQGSVSNIENYMTEATQDESTASDTGSSETESSGTIKHTLTKKGAMGVTTFGHDMIEYRQSFLNIDLMVINDLNDLFLGVY